MPPGTPVMKATVLSPLTRGCAARALLAVATIVATLAQAAVINSFDESSFAQIEQANAGKPMLVTIWSLDCPPCMKELDLLGRMKEKYPGFKLVLINSDGIEAAQEAEALLSSFGLPLNDSWIFASEQVERLRFSIDPQWYGELPRSYVYDKGVRQGYSGLIDEAWLQSWLQTAL